MRKYFIMICGLVAVIGCNTNKKELLEEYYSNGNLKSSAWTINGIFEGEGRQYFENGITANITNFKNGIRVGENIVYYNNANISITEFYNNKGELSGIRNEYYEDGVLKSRCKFASDMPDSLMELYFSNGQLERTGLFKMGKEYGRWLEYYENGQLLQDNYFENGMLSGTQVGYHKNGQLAVKGESKNGKEIGKWTILGENGDTIKVTEYNHGEVVREKIY